jgi:N-methylhydantoinase B
MGAIIRWRVEASDVECVTVGSGMLEETRAFGLLGANPGSLPTMQITSGDGSQRRIGVNAFHAVHEGDTFEIVSQGGGGFGDPLERDPDQIRRDVVDGFVSADSALAEYGAVIVGADGDPTIDWQSTRDVRSHRKSARTTKVAAAK